MSKHTVNTTFHPLAVLEHKILSHDNNLSLPHCEEVNSMVFLKDTIYLRDRRVPYNATEGQILSYSLTERSWDTNISTPKEAVSGYQLAVWSGNLVLVGGHVELKFGHQQKTFKVWVRQGNKWNADIIPPVPMTRFCQQLAMNIFFSYCARHPAAIIYRSKILSLAFFVTMVMPALSNGKHNLKAPQLSIIITNRLVS